MAVNLKADPEKGWKTMGLFKVDPKLIKQAKEAGIVCVTTTPGVYTIKNKTQVFSNITVKTAALSLVEQNSLGPGSVEQYKFNFEAGLKKALASTPKPGGIAAAVEAADDLLEVKTIPPKVSIPSSAWPMPKAAGADAGYTPSTAPDPGPASVVPGMPPIALKSATNVYQKVKGTSDTSVYHVFALFPGLNLAARVQGTKLSVRAEGAALDSYLQTLQLNFKMDKNNGYASAHYVINEGKELMVKTLAAIVGVLGFQKVVKVADLQAFINTLAG